MEFKKTCLSLYLPIDIHRCEVMCQLHVEHTVLQLFWRIELIVHIIISVLPGPHLHLCHVKHLRVKCIAQGHNIETMAQHIEERNMIFLLH